MVIGEAHHPNVGGPCKLRILRRRLSSHPTPAAQYRVFDEEYIDGRRSCSPASREHELPALNPASRTSPTYHEVNTAVLTTTAEIERHEARLYQKGYTPSEIRNKITTMMRDSNPDQPMLDFQEKDIPPAHRDAHTHRLLTDLLQQRNRMDDDFTLPPDAVAKDGSSLLDPRTYETEYLHRDKEYNRLNRSMYHIYAASAHIIHDNNFLSYCRPDLRNLPVATAFKLAALKLSLRHPTEDKPPYQTITRPTTAQTQPVFSAPRPSFADVVRPVLNPRPQWMKEHPPFHTDADADRVWHQANETRFGLRSPTNLELQQQIDHLQQMLND
jgi:hypothetical protein